MFRDQLFCITLKKPVAPKPLKFRHHPCEGRPAIATQALWILRLRALACIALGALWMCSGSLHADVFTDGDHVMLQFGPYVYHYHHSDEHNDAPSLLGLEWESATRWEIGASYFKNSFYQPCVYLYGGKRWFWKGADDGPYFKITGGPLYGYKGAYEDKIPLNSEGVGLAIIPALGYQYQRASAQLVILGTAAVMLTFGYDFGR